MTMRNCWFAGLACGAVFTAYVVHFNWRVLGHRLDEGPSITDVGFFLLGFGTPMLLISFIAAGLIHTLFGDTDGNDHTPESHGRDDAGGIDGF